MAEGRRCVFGDGGPLVVLQATAVSRWQGASDYEHSLMNGGTVETDYDVICASSSDGDVSLVNRHERDMLVLWDSEEGASVLPPDLLALPSDALVLTLCYADNDVSNPVAKIREHVQSRDPQFSLSFDVRDEMLRLQVGADSQEPHYMYGHLDIPVVPGIKHCEVYLVEHDSFRHEVVIITEQE